MNADAALAERNRKITIGFNNFAHAVDHYVMLIFPTVVIGLEAVYGRPYSELLALGTASFFAFGIFSLPAGWIASASGARSVSRFLMSCRAARRAERGPRPGIRARSWIRRSISGPATACAMDANSRDGWDAHTADYGAGGRMGRYGGAERVRPAL